MRIRTTEPNEQQSALMKNTTEPACLDDHTQGQIAVKHLTGQLCAYASRSHSSLFPFPSVRRCIRNYRRFLTRITRAPPSGGNQSQRVFVVTAFRFVWTLSNTPTPAPHVILSAHVLVHLTRPYSRGRDTGMPRATAEAALGLGYGRSYTRLKQNLKSLSPADLSRPGVV